jgi:hypothetical protein
MGIFCTSARAGAAARVFCVEIKPVVGVAGLIVAGEILLLLKLTAGGKDAHAILELPPAYSNRSYCTTARPQRTRVDDHTLRMES